MIVLIAMYCQFGLIWEKYYKRKAKWRITTAVLLHFHRKSKVWNLHSIDDGIVRYLRHSVNYLA
jgi:hypothetical protein